MKDLLSTPDIAGWERDKARFLDAEDFFRSARARMRDDLRFTVEQEHYLDDDPQSLDRRRIKPKDPALFNQVRHKKARILKNMRHFETHPIGGGTDPIAADYWERRLQLYDNDPQHCVRPTLDRFLTGALACGAWALEWAHHPHAGLVLRQLAPDRVGWHPAYLSPADPECPWAYTVTWMTPAEIEAMSDASVDARKRWRNTKGITGDSIPDEGSASADSEIVRFGSGSAALTPGPTKTKLIAVLTFYYRFAFETVKREPAEWTAIPEDAQFMHCDLCEWDSPPQSESPIPYPEAMPCPTCGQMAKKVVAEGAAPEVLKYRRGQMMRISAPFAGKTFYEGEWWFESETNGFPIDLWEVYPHPTKALPPGETFYYKSLVLISDATYRMGYEAILRSKGIFMLPDGPDELLDAFGEPWQLSDWQDVAYYQNASLPNGGIQFFQPPGLPVGYVPFLQSIQAAFERNKGTGDVGFAPEQSRDIAYRSLALQVETGEIPVDEHIASIQSFWSRMKTRQAEILKSIDPDGYAMDVFGPDGSVAASVTARSLPGVDIIVTAEPQISQQQADDFQKVAAALQGAGVMGLPLAAQLVGMPQRYVEQLTALAQQAADQQAQAAAQEQAMASMQAAAKGNGKNGAGAPQGVGLGMPPGSR